MTTHSPGLGLNEGLLESGMSFDELYVRQIAVGGDSGNLEVEAYVLGLLVPDKLTHNVIAQALNEHFVERGLDHPVRYIEED